MKNEVAYGYEACLRHINNEKCASLHASVSERFIFAKQMHHIAAGDASFEDIQGLRLDLFAKMDIIKQRKGGYDAVL